jgi:hypothetical protein
MDSTAAATYGAIYGKFISEAPSPPPQEGQGAQHTHIPFKCKPSD